MKTILDKRISDSLSFYFQGMVDYQTFCKAVKWDGQTSGLLHEWLMLKKEAMINVPIEMMSISDDLIESVKKARTFYKPVIRAINAINNRRFNFEKIVSRGAYSKFNMTMTYDESKSLYNINFPDLGVTILTDRRNVEDVIFDFSKL